MIEIEFVWGRDLDQDRKVVRWPVVPRRGEYVDVGLDFDLKVKRVEYGKNGAIKIRLDWP